MLSALVRFELKYHTRQVTFILAAIIFLCLGLVSTMGNFGGGEAYKNGPYVVTYITSFISLFIIFVSTLFCANVVLRDATCNMESIIYSTSLQRSTWFLVRWLGLLVTTFLVLSLTVVGIWLGSILLGNPEETGPSNFLYFLHPLFVFGLPNVFFCSAIIFSVALLTRSARTVYVAGVGLFILYFVASILGNSPIMANSLKTDDPPILPYLLDPFGLASFLGQTRNWSDTQRNQQFFPVQGVFLVNRLLWTALSVALLAISYRFLRFRVTPPAKAAKKQTSGHTAKALPYRIVATKATGAMYLRTAFLSQLKIETASVFKHIPFVAMLALWILLNGIELKENLLHGIYNTRFYAATGFIVEELRQMRPLIMLLVFYAAELIHRERTANIQGLVFSSPVLNSILWGAKFTTLAVMVLTFVTANILTGIGMQVFTGFPHIDLTAYASLYYYSGLPLFLFAALIIFLQTLIPGKYTGMLISMVVAGIFLFSNTLGIRNYLFRYAILPDLTYSPMHGFGHYAQAVNWYLLYWTALAAVLSMLAAALWQGSTHTTWKQRVLRIGTRWNKTGKLFLAVCLLIFIGAGCYIHSQATSVSTARYGKAAKDWQAGYEKKYKHLASQPQPYITAVNTTIDLYPQQNKYTVKGSYRLRNESNTPITQLWLGVDPEVNSIHFSLPGAQAGAADPLYKQYEYKLQQPLQPGSETSLQFTMEVERSGFTPFNKEHYILSNGSYIELEKYVPYIGYNDRFEIDDVYVRRQQGLPPMTSIPPADSNYHLIHYETTVSTDGDQQAITVGQLQRTWTDKGRNYFYYKTVQPINFMLALSTARYAVQKETYKGIHLSLYHHPGQTYNTATMLQAMKDAIDYGNTHFSKYPLNYLTLAEIPYYPGAATAYPGVLFSTERINFMSNYTDSARFNNTYTITAHETGHQWWANQLAPYDAPGRGTLTESLAKYTEFVTAEKRFDQTYLHQTLLADNQLYFALRTTTGEDEAPLYQAYQTFVFYQKGGRALYAIKEELGEERFDRALQRLIAQHAAPAPKATTHDLLQALYKEATPAQIRHIDNHFKKIVLYSNSLQVKSCEALPNGKFRLQVQVNIVKADQGGGKEQTMPPDDEIPLAVFDQPAIEWTKQTKPIYLNKHLFTSAHTMLTIIVDKKPAVVLLDPWVGLSDADQEDNKAVVP